MKPIQQFSGKKWILEGILFGVFMYILNVFIFPLIGIGEWHSTKKIITALPIWLLGGLGYGYTMKMYYNRKNKK